MLKIRDFVEARIYDDEEAVNHRSPVTDLTLLLKRR